MDSGVFFLDKWFEEECIFTKASANPKQAASVDCIVGSAQPAQSKPARVVGMEFSWSNLEKQ